MKTHKGLSDDSLSGMANVNMENISVPNAESNLVVYVLLIVVGVGEWESAWEGDVSWTDVGDGVAE